MEFTITPELCTSCGLCLADCPAKTIRKEKEAYRIISDGCIECSHCGMVCPVNAIRADGKELPPYPEDLESLTGEERHEHLILSKRSVRQYKTAPLNEEDIMSIIRAGETTATASNSQHCEAHVFQGGEVAMLASLLARSIMQFTRIGLTGIGRAILIIGGMGRYAKKDVVLGFHKQLQLAMEGKADPLFFNAPAVVVLTYPAKRGKRFGRTDCALAGENMMLNAHARNIGSCMIGFAEVALHSARLRKKIGIPKDRKIGLIFTLGYTERKYYRYPIRKSWNY